MRAVVDRKDFESVLRWHSAGSGLRLLYAHVEDDVLVVESCGETEWKRTRLATTEREPGEARFSMGRITEQMKTNKKAATVELAVEKSNVITKVGRSKSASPIVQEISSWWSPAEEPVDVAEADLEDLRWCFKAASHAAARPSQEAAEQLKGVKVKIADGMITLHATDAYRLASAQAECMSSGEIEFLTYPAHFLGALGMMTNPVSIVCDRDHYGVTNGVHTSILRSVAGQMRDISGVLNKAKGYTEDAVIPVEELSSAVTGVGAGRLGQVEITFHEDYLSVTNAISMEGMAGLTEAEVEGVITSELDGCVIRVNATNLIEMLRAVRTERVSISTNDKPRSPLIIREVMDDKEKGDYSGTSYLGFVALVNR